ncbi:brkDBD domain-containing protein [Trichonephila clavipes]|nr:brkDBD domain-containing protein [Trichonephila clavipes]
MKAKKELIEWCMKEGLIASSYECPKCNDRHDVTWSAIKRFLQNRTCHAEWQSQGQIVCGEEETEHGLSSLKKTAQTLNDVQFRKIFLCLDNEHILGGDQGYIPEIMDEILTTTRDLELEVNGDDIEELMMRHEDELTTEEL